MHIIRTLAKLFFSRYRWLWAALALLMVIAASIIYMYEKNGSYEGVEATSGRGALANATDMLRELFSRSPGARHGMLLATKRSYRMNAQGPVGQPRSPVSAPPLQQRALGKIFDNEPVVPSFGGQFAPEPFTLLYVSDDPLSDYAPRDSFPPVPGHWLEYGGNPPFYILPPGAGDISPPATAPVPEPAAWGMLLLGFSACGAVLRRRRHAPRLAGGRA